MQGIKRSRQIIGMAALGLFCAALGTGDIEASSVTWSHPTQITFETETHQQANGSWLHEVQITNHEDLGIWFLNLYTGPSFAYNFTASLPEWEANAYIDYAFAGKAWSLPDSPDSWTLGFFDSMGPEQASLIPGMSVSLSFFTDAPLTTPLAYGYQVQGFSDFNAYTAIGPEAIPEPSTLALLGLGLLWLAGFAAKRRRTPHGSAALLPTMLAFLAMAQPYSHAASDVVISQVYGGGGNSGATLTHDYIELHNRSQSPQDITGWSVQYASATGSTWQRTLLSGVLPPGGYYLVQQAQGTGGTQALPTPDAIGTLAMSATAGKVALVPSSTLLSGTCPTGFFDLLGYGGANCFEGTAPAQVLTNTTASLRASEGCEDTDDNAADFSRGAPYPRHSGTAAFVCAGEVAPQIISMNPAQGSTNAPPNTNITLTFSEPVQAPQHAFNLQGSVTGIKTFTLTGGPKVFTLAPTQAFVPGEIATVTVTGSLITDLDLEDPPDAMENDFIADFTIALPVKIAAIQGTSHLSPLDGEWVGGVQGVVTAVMANGFFMQDPLPDANPITSDGIFVFTSTAPTVATGDAVSVNGRVQEYRPGGASGANLTLTEIVTPTVTLQSSGNALPAPILLGAGGRMPPTEVIDDDATGSVENSGSFDPASDGIDFYESLEGMRVSLIDPVVVGPTNRFGEFFVLPDAGTGFGLRTARGGIKVRAHDFNPERLLIDDALMTTPQVKVGDFFVGAIEGVVDYNFGNFRIQPAALPPVIDGGLQRKVADSLCANQLTVATFNVENLDANDSPEKFTRLAAIIVNSLRSPLLVALEEVQDNNGPINDGITDASLTAATLIAAIQAAGGPTYHYVDIAPQHNQDGGEPGGNIRVGFLYQADQGLVFIPRPGGDAITPVRAIKTPTGIRLSASPGRIDPLNPAFANSRKPLVAEFKYRGRAFFFIANHFNSKGGDQPLMGRFQPPLRNSEIQRNAQALAVNQFAQSILNLDPAARIVVLGDFNDFEFSEVMQTLKGTALINLMENLPENQRYSYVFEGNSQALDHILVSPALANNPSTHYEVVHVNAEFPDPISDHEPQRACFEKGRP